MLLGTQKAQQYKQIGSTKRYSLLLVGTAYGNRTHDLAVRGPRLNLLTKAADVSSSYLQTDFTYYILLASSWQVFFKKEMGILYDFQKYAW